MPNRTLSDTNFGLRMPVELRDRATAVAAARGRTLAGEIRWLLSRLVAEHEQAARTGRQVEWLDEIPPKSETPTGDGRLAKTTDRGGRRDGS